MALEDNLDKVLFSSNLPLNRILDSGEFVMSVEGGEFHSTGGGNIEVDPGRTTEVIPHGQDFAPFSFCLFNTPPQVVIEPVGNNLWFEIGTEPAQEDGGYGYDTGYMSALCWTDSQNLTLRGVNYWGTEPVEMNIKWFLYAFGDNI